MGMMLATSRCAAGRRTVIRLTSESRRFLMLARNVFSADLPLAPGCSAARYRCPDVKQNDVGLHGGVEAETSIVPTGSIIAEQIIGKMVDPIPAVALMVYLRRCGECRRRI